MPISNLLDIYVSNLKQGLDESFIFLGTNSKMPIVLAALDINRDCIKKREMVSLRNGLLYKMTRKNYIEVLRYYFYKRDNLADRQKHGLKE